MGLRGAIMKYYNIELSMAAANKLQQFLKSNGINYEISAAGTLLHLEILTDASGAAVINEFLDSIEV